MSVAPYAGPPGEFPSHSLFDGAVSREEATRVLFTDADGVHFGWQFTEAAAPAVGATGPDRVLLGGLKTPSAAKLAAIAAQQATNDAANAKDTLARNTIIAQVNAIKNNGQTPAQWSNADKRFMALVWILHRLD